STSYSTLDLTLRLYKLSSTMTKPETYVVDSLACIKNGWFTEDIETSKGQAFCLEVKRVLHHERSPYQDVLVFESTNHGNVLVLDGIIQCTEREEFAYQE
ncbi:putrescine aminopropyltransferase, partial [Dimargaris cristalligena]